MFPWFWMWAPQLHYPLSGSVAQRIQPDTRWFFGAIPGQAGIGELEQRIFETASYGRQLGKLTEAVLALADPELARSAEGQQRIAELQQLAERIEAVKREDAQALEAHLRSQLDALRARNPEAVQALLAQYAQPGG